MISLLAGKLGTTGFGATLAGLAARGWFQVNGLAGQARPDWAEPGTGGVGHVRGARRDAG